MKWVDWQVRGIPSICLMVGKNVTYSSSVADMRYIVYHGTNENKQTSPEANSSIISLVLGSVW